MKNYILLLLLTPSFGFAQNTLHYNDEKGSEKATLEDISWLTGTWKGDAFGGEFEENWSKPTGGSMMFNFKLVAEGKFGFKLNDCPFLPVAFLNESKEVHCVPPIIANLVPAVIK